MCVDESYQKGLHVYMNYITNPSLDIIDIRDDVAGEV